jgi:molecular chaperone GrpE
MKKSAENEEILIDADSGEEIELEESEVTNVALKTKLKNLRADLLSAQKERDENLAGWQRAKADLANFRRTVGEDKERDAARAQGTFIRAIIPSLDSFESAMADKSWNSVDKEWRDGVERIANQINSALSDAGLTSFGKEHEDFDPLLHECMSVVPTKHKKEDHTIAQIMQKGYKIGSEIIRPAKVIVAQTP